MTTAEKLDLLETIWADLCQTPGDIRSPEWHREVIADRKSRLEHGQSTTSSWAEAKARLQQLGE